MLETDDNSLASDRAGGRVSRGSYVRYYAPRKVTRVVPKVMSNFFFFLACELGTADEGDCGGRWNQLLCYPGVPCDVNSLHHVTSITPNKMAYNDMSFR